MLTGNSLDQVIFSDGINSITIAASENSSNGGYAESTTYTAVINGETTTGVLAPAFNIGARYQSCRGGSANGAVSDIWFNPRFRVDKYRGEVSLWLNDQIKGAVSIAGLENFGICTWQYIHIPASYYMHYATVKQIGLRIEC